MRPLFVVLRLVFALSALYGLLWQGGEAVAVSATDGIGPATALTDYFSYFTVDSNALFAIVLVTGAVVLARRPRTVAPSAHAHRWYPRVRLIAVVAMVTTGIVYNLLLRDGPPTPDLASAANEALHSVGPAFAIVDWLVAPGRARLRWREVWWPVLFPLVWLGYTFLRTPIAVDPFTNRAGWLPYPFLYGSLADVAPTLLTIVALVVALALLAVLATRRGRPMLVAAP